MGLPLIAHFADDKNFARMLAIIDSWIGTPYRHGTMIRGRGADCTLLLGACLLEYGILTDVVWEYYPHDWYLTATDERILNGVVKHFTEHVARGFSIERIAPTDPLLQGDLLAFETTRRGVSNHAAMFIGWPGRPREGRGEMVHAHPLSGVSRFPMAGFFSRHLTNVFRIVEV